MHKRLMKPGLCLLMLALALTLLHSPTLITQTASAHTRAPSPMSGWIVYLKTANPTSGKITGVDTVARLKTMAKTSQRRLTDVLSQHVRQGDVQSFQSLWIINALVVTTNDAVIQTLAQQPEVLRVEPDRVITFLKQPTHINSPQQTQFLTPTPNLDLINAPAMWNLGFSGQGLTVAILDTGVDVSHPDLAAKYRGGSNSWFDPYDQHTDAPLDLDGHGTQVLGVILAGDASGQQLGVAPDAKWIAARIYNDHGDGTTSAIHRVFQWVLDPDNDPATHDAPQIVNNSWDTLSSLGGCNLTFEPDLRVLRAAGILPVFASGNSKINVSPANNPSAFSIGATDNTDALYVDSGQGPRSISCGLGIYPDLVAPGVGITTTDTFGFYINDTGTSLAAPHVAGALALLLSARPNLSANAQASALRNGAVDLGAAGPDNTFGYGRLDVLKAHQWLSTTSDVSVTLTASSNPTITQAGFVYTVTLTNLGPLTATQVVLTLTLPAGLMVATIPAGCAGAEVMICNIAEINPSAAISFSVPISVQQSAPNTLVSTIALSAEQPDPDVDNNVASDELTLVRLYHLPIIFQRAVFKRFFYLPAVMRSTPA